MDLITPEAAARRLAVKMTTLERWRRAGVGPRCVRIGRKVIRYRAADLERWIAKHLDSSKLRA